jgi:hypothetical protein
MVKKISFLLGVIVTFMFFNCKRYSKLLIHRKDVNTSTLNLNGYYFLEESGENKGLKSIYFLYKNGILLYAGSYKDSEINSIEKKIIKDYLNNSNEIAKRNLINWGVFSIDGTEISMEKWEPTEGMRRTSIKRGIVLNNQSFIINYLYSPFSNKNNKVSDIYHFRTFSPKPDSTNNFIK